MREIVIDTDTRIYYIYEDKSYYIENKNTTTPRADVTEAKKVLDIVAPNNEVTIDDLVALATNPEYLTSLSFTYSDDGAYIATIQLNDFSKHPIALNAEKSKLYIMNTDYIFDLTLTEGRRNRLDIMQAYYKDVLGLQLTLQELTALYTLITRDYNSTAYNVIKAPEDSTTALYYNDQIKLSNYRKNSPAVYTITSNPNKKYTYNTVAHIMQIQNNAILLSTDAPSFIKAGMQLQVYNTETTVDTTSYTADGLYTIQEVSGNLILTTENLSSPYLYQPPTLFARAYEAPVVAVDRDERSITLPDTSYATYFTVGDSIIIHGTRIPTEYETLTVDGTYTIQGIDNNIIYTEEFPKTNYEVPIGELTPHAYVYKPIQLVPINNITGTAITIEGDTVPSLIEVNSPIMVSYANGVEDPTLEYAKVIGIDSTLLTVDSELTEFTANYGLLRQPIPYPDTLIQVEESLKPSILPVGSFMVDNTDQCSAYLSLLSGLVVPTEDHYNSFNQQVSTSVDVVVGNVTTMKLLGLYSEIYEEGTGI